MYGFHISSLTDKCIGRNKKSFREKNMKYHLQMLEIKYKYFPSNICKLWAEFNGVNSAYTYHSGSNQLKARTV